MRGCGWQSAASCWMGGVTIFYPQPANRQRREVEPTRSSTLVQLLGADEDWPRIAAYGLQHIENSIIGDGVTLKPGTLIGRVARRCGKACNRTVHAYASGS